MPVFDRHGHESDPVPIGSVATRFIEHSGTEEKSGLSPSSVSLSPGLERLGLRSGGESFAALSEGLQNALANCDVPVAAGFREAVNVSAPNDLDLISFLRGIPVPRMRRGVRIPSWYLLLVAVLGILSRCESLRDLERYADRHHDVLTETLGIELRRHPSDSAFRYFFQQVDVAAICAAIRDWTIAQILGGAAELDQLICDGKTLRGSIETTAGGGSGFMAQVTLYSAEMVGLPAELAA